MCVCALIYTSPLLLMELCMSCIWLCAYVWPGCLSPKRRACFVQLFPLAESQTLQCIIAYQFRIMYDLANNVWLWHLQIWPNKSRPHFPFSPGPIPVTPQAVPPTEPASFPASSAALAEFLRRFGGFGRGQRPRCWQQLLGLPGDRTAGSDGAAWRMGRFLTDVSPTGKAFKETRARKRDDVITNPA